MNAAELEIPNPWEIRQELMEMTLEQILGPAGGPEEILAQDPRQRYLVGILAPQEVEKPEVEKPEVDANADPANETAKLLLEEDDSPEAGKVPEEGHPESPVGKAVPMFEPASFGFSFTLAKESPALIAEVNFGIYQKLDKESDPSNQTDSKTTLWQRIPVQGASEPIVLKSCQQQDVPMVWGPGTPVGIELKITLREYPDGWVGTLFLLNHQAPLKTRKSEAFLFQTELNLCAQDQSPVFIKRLQRPLQSRLDSRDLAEKEALEMLYHNQVEFAVGHGISVHADTYPQQPHQAWRIATRALPCFEVPQTRHTQVADLETDMAVLAQLSPEELNQALMPLTTGYQRWAEALMPASPNETEMLALARCQEAQERILAGIELLAQNEQAYTAFQAANQAMHQQRIHALWSLRKRRGEKDLALEAVDMPANRTWRPFQLAFILINLPGLTLLDHPERSDQPNAVADLLWFPTGGGKTEAYLGLTAYTLFLRRLMGVVGDYSGMDGVAVLMRYTLRLLTLQQFQRATALICACELIRSKDESRWGKTPFRIGLWVGQNTTPNKTKESQQFVENLLGEYKEQQSGGHTSPLQLTHCPWCGAEINAKKHLKVEGAFPGERGRTLIYCGHASCEFGKRLSPKEGLPVVVVDEEIYRLLPALVIATVDKFAQMPWNGQIQMLFGQVNQYCSRHGFRSPETEDSDSHHASGSNEAARSHFVHPLRPPDLIIQDELHLISGPLGSMVGLYETAVDKLCSWQVNGQTVRPKIVLSTATIRRATTQVRELFHRQVAIFPPHGLDICDNFFSKQVVPGPESPGRRYLGVCAPGRKLKEVQITVYSSLLAAAETLYKKYGKAVDPWMTLVGYFNTTRELGGTRTLLRDDIATNLKQMDKQGLAVRNLWDNGIEELTSRINADRIKNILEKMEVPFDPLSDAERKAAAERAKANNTPYDGPARPADILLATNMISVGVDIDRLGLMVMMRQPKTTAEYIQASSRVGRSSQAPGLVFTLFNWAHPRDLSHYEVFEHYHETFYKHVEAISVTPFSARALDRGLSALLVTLIRLSSTDYNRNESADALSPNWPKLAEITGYIARRASEIRQDRQLEQSIRSELATRLDFWQKTIQEMRHYQKKLGYKGKKGNTDGLLKDAGLIDPDNPTRTLKWEPFTCLNSLRNVEPQIPLILNHPHPRWQGRPPLQGFTESPTEREIKA
ncbi:MAG: helicase [Candidatus Sericytochromatia bacterium]|nr:helicase [Candidatus Sericytochromatia bacterium]